MGERPAAVSTQDAAADGDVLTVQRVRIWIREFDADAGRLAVKAEVVERNNLRAAAHVSEVERSCRARPGETEGARATASFKAFGQPSVDAIMSAVEDAGGEPSAVLDAGAGADAPARHQRHHRSRALWDAITSDRSDGDALAWYDGHVTAVRMHGQDSFRAIAPAPIGIGRGKRTVGGGNAQAATAAHVGGTSQQQNKYADAGGQQNGARRDEQQDRPQHAPAFEPEQLPAYHQWTSCRGNVWANETEELQFVPYLDEDQEISDKFFELHSRTTSDVPDVRLRELAIGLLERVEREYGFGEVDKVEALVAHLNTIIKMGAGGDPWITKEWYERYLSERDNPSLSRMRWMKDALRPQKRLGAGADGGAGTRDDGGYGGSGANEQPPAWSAFRGIFCRRCFTYGCAMGHALPQPVRLDAEDAVGADAQRGLARQKRSARSPPPKVKKTKGSKSSKLQSNGAATERLMSGSEVLDALPDAVLSRMHMLVDAGDYATMAGMLGDDASAEHLERVCRSRGVGWPKGSAGDGEGDGKGRNNAGGGNTFRPAKRRRLYGRPKDNRNKVKPGHDNRLHANAMKLMHGDTAAEDDAPTAVHAYVPCNCEGPCNPTTCSCIRNKTFCEQFCACPPDCPHRFQGCRCKKGQCRTRACACFRMNRECVFGLCKCADDAPGGGECMEPSCCNMSIQLGLHKRVLVSPSDVHGWGLFARDAIPKGAFIIEYKGEAMSQEEAERRGTLHDARRCTFLFEVNQDVCLDAKRRGNKAKYINHHEDNNCCARIMTVRGDHRIGIFAAADIAPGDELFFDYNFQNDAAMVHELGGLNDSDEDDHADGTSSQE